MCEEEKWPVRPSSYHAGVQRSVLLLHHKEIKINIIFLFFISVTCARESCGVRSMRIFRILGGEVQELSFFLQVLRKQEFIAKLR